MKTKNKAWHLLTVSFVLLSCQKLDRELQTDLTQTQIEGSYVNLQYLINGVYSELRDGFQEIGGEAMMASATDEAEHTIETSTVQLFNQGAWNAVNNPADNWVSCFRAVRRANLFLESSDTGKVNLDPYKSDLATFNQKVSDIKRWRYEARFLRAFFYFELIKRYGGVPIFTTTVSEENTQTARRQTLQQCIAFVSAECDSAANNLPISYSTGELGRVTKGAAIALKSRMLLYAASDLFNSSSWADGYARPELISLSAGDRGARWKAAADAAKALIDLNGTGYALATNYKDLFTVFNSPEIIFSRRNVASNTFEVINFPIGFDRGNSGTTPTQDLVDAYEVKVSATTSIPFNWSNPNHASSPYSNRDPRLAFTVVTNNSLYDGNGVSRNIELWSGGRDGLPTPRASRTGYYLRKYVKEGTNLINNSGSSAHSWIYFRLAEIYLNYVEALNEYAPGSADIKLFLDRIRSRTGVAMPPVPMGSQTEMRQRIRNERRIELAFEDHRAWDTRRWMIAPSVLGGPVRGVGIIKANSSTFTYTPFVVENRTFHPKMFLFPIPQNDLNIANNLSQNPLW